MQQQRPFVVILMGSDSDLPVMQASIDLLNRYRVPVEVRIRSAHRTPDATRETVADAEARGASVFIAAAGLAAHLAGAVAAMTIKPVIGVPMDAGPLNGMDALLSTVQMPGGIPVACTAIGKAGAKNAAYLAIQILALQDSSLAGKLAAERVDNIKQILAKDDAMQSKLGA